MLYYRYRSPTEISFKEVLYNELYFSSAEECNDPFDSKTFFVFPNNVDKWEKLLAMAWKPFADLSLTPKIKTSAQRISEKCPLGYEEALSDSLLRDCLPALGAFTDVLVDALRETLKTYRPSARYFASFSEVRDESLMWSHYADKHRGFCLIFRAIDGRLNQYRPRMKRGFDFETPNGLAPSMSYGIPESFQFKRISYEEIVVTQNAFNCFPEFVAGKIESDAMRLKLISSMEEGYFQKHISWNYEKEVRLSLSSPMPWLFGAHQDYSRQQRLFQYEPTQLVGVIFGIKISTEDKLRIFEIVRIHQDMIAQSADHKRIVFDFVAYQAEPGANERKIKITPERIFSLGNEWRSSDANFDDRYNRWLEGRGLQFDGSRCTNVRVT